MTVVTHTMRGPRALPGGWWVGAAGVLLLIAVSCLAVVVLGQPSASSGQAAIPLNLPDPAVTAPAAGSATSPAVGGTEARFMPTSLRIPTLDLTVSVGKLGLNPDRTVEVPTNAAEPGWFRLGPTPGQIGSSVILGHVDSKQGPAVFYRLKTMQPGDRVEVGLANGAVAKFEVKEVVTYPRQNFPAKKVYGSQGYSALNLVTCGGKFDRKSDSYLSNVVVYTTLVATIRAR